MTIANGRTADHPIEPLFLQRWSPRSFTDEPIAEADLATLFEAARWAPSSSNQQPWRFLYATRDSAEWPLFFELLKDGNKRWAAGSAALVAVLSKRSIDAKGDKPARANESHSFDAGAAWACLALQAAAMGWATHAMGGFDRDRAIGDLAVPDAYRIETMIAIGRHRPESPPAERNGRSPQASFVKRGVFPTAR